jgi:polysaccharide export outer membrane protein
MQFKSSYRLFGCIALLSAVSACCGTAVAQYLGPAISTSAPTASVPQPAIQPEPTDSAIMPGDIISIVTAGVPELTTTSVTSPDNLNNNANQVISGLKVGPLGTITLPYIGTVKVAGLSPSEAAQFLEAKLKDGGFLVDPQVSVTLGESPTRVITVIGEVVKPATVPAYGQVRLLQAVASCGGFTSNASHTITLRRAGNPNPIPIELGTDPQNADVTNIELMAGDTIIVPKVGNIFVVGEVKNAEAIPLASNTPITVMRAIAIAGGLKYSAALSNARIIRTTPDNHVLEIKLDLKKVMLSKQADVALLNDDVLFVPANVFKSIISSNGAAVAAESVYYGALIAK